MVLSMLTETRIMYEKAVVQTSDYLNNLSNLLLVSTSCLFVSVVGLHTLFSKKISHYFNVYDNW